MVDGHLNFHRAVNNTKKESERRASIEFCRLQERQRRGIHDDKEMRYIQHLCPYIN